MRASLQIPSYAVGTIAIAAKSGNVWPVTGVLTNWTATDGTPYWPIAPMEILICNGAIGIIDSVTDATHLNLCYWSGGVVSAGASYQIARLVPSPSLSMQGLVSSLLSYLGNGGARLTPDGSGNMLMQVLNGSNAWVNALSINTTTGIVSLPSGSSWNVPTALTAATVSASGAATATFSATSSAVYTDIVLANTSAGGKTYFIETGGAGGAFSGGAFGIYDSTAGAVRFSISPSGAVTIPGSLTVSGALSAPIKTGALVLSGASTVTLAASGFVVELTGSSGYTTILPTPVGNAGVSFSIWNNSSVVQTLSTNSSGNFIGPNGSNASTLSVPIGWGGFVYSDGFNYCAEFTPNYIAANKAGDTFSGSVTVSTNTAAPLTVTSSNATTNILLNNTSSNGRQYEITSGGSGGNFAGGTFGIWDTSAAAARLAILSGGNVGIGTTTPAQKLEVSGNIKIASGYGLEEAATGGYHGFNVFWQSGTNWTLRAADYGYYWRHNGATHTLYGCNTGAAGSSIATSNPAITVSGATGYVGIGASTTPDAPLMVTSGATGALSQLVKILAPNLAQATGGTTSSVLGVVLGKAVATNQCAWMSYHYDTTVTNSFLGWGHWGSLEQMVLTQAGFVGIGTTTPTNQLHVSSSATSPVRVTSSAGWTDIVLANTGTNGHTYFIETGSTAGAYQNGGFGIWDSTAGASRFSITATGQVHTPGALYADGSESWTGSYFYYANAANGAATSATGNWSLICANRARAAEWDATSDARLKDNIEPVPLSFAWSFVDYATPVFHEWKDPAEKGRRVGFIAQELAKAGFSEIVSLSPNEALEETVDEDGFVSPAGAQFSIAYDKIVPLLTATIADLRRRTVELEERLARLEGNSI